MKIQVEEDKCKVLHAKYSSREQRIYSSRYVSGHGGSTARGRAASRLARSCCANGIETRTPSTICNLARYCIALKTARQKDKAKRYRFVISCTSQKSVELIVPRQCSNYIELIRYLIKINVSFVNVCSSDCRRCLKLVPPQDLHVYR